MNPKRRTSKLIPSRGQELRINKIKNKIKRMKRRPRATARAS